MITIILVLLLLKDIINVSPNMALSLFIGCLIIELVEIVVAFTSQQPK